MHNICTGEDGSFRVPSVWDRSFSLWQGKVALVFTIMGINFNVVIRTRILPCTTINIMEGVSDESDS